VVDRLSRLELGQLGLDEVDRNGEADARAGVRGAVVAIWSTMPMTLPAASSTGPPELPGFSAASVWIAWATVKPLGALIVRSSPETMPVLMLRS
jgi:hypothetical protein